MSDPEARVTKLLDLLLDVWYQFRFPVNKRLDKFHAGGLSTLEEVEETLRDAGIIDANGVTTR